MTRFTDRVERDLGQIADRATPSSTAWEAIQQRIAEQDTQPTSEVIMLSPERNEPRTRTRPWMMAAAVVAALALIGGLIVAGTRSGEDQDPVDEPVPTVVDLTPVTTFATRNGPFGVVSDGTSVWITNINEVTDSVSKMNPVDGTRVDYPTGEDPGRTGPSPRAGVFDGSHVWFANNDNTVSKLDPVDGTRVEFPTSALAGTTPLGMAFDGSSIWIANPGSDSVSRMNPDDGSRTDFSTGAGPTGVVFDGSSIWVVNNEENTVSKIDPVDGTRVDYPTGVQPVAVAFDGSSIWITNSGDDTVSKMNPGDGTRVDYVAGVQPFAVTFDGSSIWVTNSGDDTVSKFDPNDGARVDVDAGSTPRGMAFDGTYIWVANNGDDTVSRIDPSSVVATPTADGDASPAPTEDELTAMAVIGSGAGDEIVIRSEPSASAEVVTTISPFDTAVAVSFVESFRTEDEEWVRVGRVGSLVVDGWTPSSNVTPVDGGDEQPRSLLEYVSSVRAALGGVDPAAGLAELTDELRMSTDVSFTDDDAVFTASELADGAAADLLTEVVSSTSIEQTQEISVDRRNRAETGDTIENIVAVFPDAVVVDLHYVGDPDDRPGTWASTLLVIQPDADGGVTNPWRLVGIALDGPTG